jgi:arsenite-transporting ATPase
MLEGDPIIARLQERKETFEFAGEALRNEAAFFLVVNPDELSLRETSRAVENLLDADLAVEGLAVNKLTPIPDPEEQGRGARFLRDRVETERERLDTLREEFDQPIVAEIETRVAEVKGSLLEDVAGELEIDVAAESTA